MIHRPFGGGFGYKRPVGETSCVVDCWLTGDGSVSLPERQWNMWIPGYGSEEIRPFKKACTTEAHKQVSAFEGVSFVNKFVQVLVLASDQI